MQPVLQHPQQSQDKLRLNRNFSKLRQRYLRQNRNYYRRQSRNYYRLNQGYLRESRNNLWL